jgi:glycerol-3-phosphate acyltransferase PlsY
MNTTLVLLGYIVGSIPFGLLLTWKFSGIDVRQIGSGNIGATNTLRAAGRSAALAVVMLDAAKGVVPVLVVERMGASDMNCAAVGLATIIGHIYPVWLRFRGGKGVATTAGVFGVLAPVAVAATAGLFFVLVWRTRYVSVGSIVASIALVPLTYLIAEPLHIVVVASFSAALIVYRHWENITRLKLGIEPRLGAEIQG